MGAPNARPRLGGEGTSQPAPWRQQTHASAPTAQPTRKQFVLNHAKNRAPDVRTRGPEPCLQPPLPSATRTAEAALRARFLVCSASLPRPGLKSALKTNAPPVGGPATPAPTCARRGSVGLRSRLKSHGIDSGNKGQRRPRQTAPARLSGAECLQCKTQERTANTQRGHRNRRSASRTWDGDSSRRARTWAQTPRALGRAPP